MKPIIKRTWLDNAYGYQLENKEGHVLSGYFKTHQDAVAGRKRFVRGLSAIPPKYSK